MFKRLKAIWTYSDSQPTEITLAIANVLLVHFAIGIELGDLYFFRSVVFLSGLFQLYCVSNSDIKCRVIASVVTFAVYAITTIMYLTHIGIPTPTHWGWFVLVFASFGSMRRLILEKLHKDLKNG